MVFAGWKFRRLSSDRHFTVALLLLIAAAILQGVLPPYLSFTSSWPFVLVLVWFLTVLGSRLFRRFSLTGTGLWLALWAGMLGSADSLSMQLVLPSQEYVQTALPFEIRLDRFSVHRYPTGEPMEFIAELSLKNETTFRKKLRVNHPVYHKHHQIYLLDYVETTGGHVPYCTVLITYQPWRWLVLLGIVLMLAGAVKRFIT